MLCALQELAEPCLPNHYLPSFHHLPIVPAPARGRSLFSSLAWAVEDLSGVAGFEYVGLVVLQQAGTGWPVGELAILPVLLALASRCPNQKPKSAHGVFPPIDHTLLLLTLPPRTPKLALRQRRHLRKKQY